MFYCFVSIKKAYISTASNLFLPQISIYFRKKSHKNPIKISQFNLPINHIKSKLKKGEDKANV